METEIVNNRIRKSEECPFCNPYDNEAQEIMKWLLCLAEYAVGCKKWDTGKEWVCESHPCTPFEQGLSFDCKCGGPGMPPITLKDLKLIKEIKEEKEKEQEIESSQ